MFENAPPNLPTTKEPEDILGSSPKTSGSVPVLPPQAVPPIAPRPVMPVTSSPPPMTTTLAPQRSVTPPKPVIIEKPSRSWIRVVLFLAVLGGFGVGAYFFITKGGLSLLKLKPEASVEQQAQTLPPPPTVPGDPPSPPPPPPPQAPLDSDGDGLTDEDEAGLGTEPLTADTDGDGLLDNEEVRIYKSDPLNSDTDNDSFKDGDEVKAGYNPIGPGRLFQVPTQ